MECSFFRRRICGASVGARERARREIRNPDMNANGYVSSRSEKRRTNKTEVLENEPNI